MKKLLGLLLVFVLVGCSAGSEESIHVYTRDASSGTREAFEKGADFEGEMRKDVNEVTSNGDMATKVGQDEYAIGYASLSTDFEASNVKPLQLNGVTPSVETVLDGSYQLQRPFMFVTREAGDFDSEEKEQLVNAFLDYLQNSVEGMTVVEKNGGIVNKENAVAWEELAKKHPIVNQDNSHLNISTSGSTSVEKTLKAALESFVPLAGNFTFTMNQEGSSEAYKSTLGKEKDGAKKADIGFASRAFKSEEEPVENAMQSGQYCIDAVVTIVNKNNTVENITLEEIKGVYTGTIVSFEELSK